MAKCAATLEVSIYFETDDAGYEATCEWPVPTCHAAMMACIGLSLAAIEDAKHPGLKDKVVSYFSVQASTKVRYGDTSEGIARHNVGDNVLPRPCVKWEVVATSMPNHQRRNHASN